MDGWGPDLADAVILAELAVDVDLDGDGGRERIGQSGGVDADGEVGDGAGGVELLDGVVWVLVEVAGGVKRRAEGEAGVSEGGDFGGEAVSGVFVGVNVPIGGEFDDEGEIEGLAWRDGGVLGDEFEGDGLLVGNAVDGRQARCSAGQTRCRDLGKSGEGQ